MTVAQKIAIRRSISARKAAAAAELAQELQKSAQARRGVFIARARAKRAA